MPPPWIDFKHDIYDYGMWFFGYYDEITGGQAEAYRAEFPDWPDAAFWLDTSVGSSNRAEMVGWKIRVEVHVKENAPRGQYTLEIGGHSIDVGTRSVLSAVPEPSSVALWGAGSLVAAMAIMIRRVPLRSPSRPSRS